MKNTFLSLKFLLVLLSATLTISAKASSHKRWIFFDLGNTIVDTKSEDGINYFEGSRDYINSLKIKGYKIGIISNIPESFGMTYDEKLKTLKKYLSDNWNGQYKFNWEVFDEILLPLDNSQLKPAEILYLKAMEYAKHCPIAYISESPKEVDKANDMGIAGHLFDKFSPELYVPLIKIDQFLEDNYMNDYPQECRSY